jgi:hypothetical protein
LVLSYDDTEPTGLKAISQLSGVTIVRVARTSDTILAAADRGKFIDVTSGTFTQTFDAPANLGDGWYIFYQNSGTGIITTAPNLGQRSAPVSVGAGGWVRWRADGRELYYVEPDGSLMAVALTFDADGNGFTAAEPQKLFSTPMALGSLNSSIGQQYMPDAYGTRFLVLAAAPARSPVHVLGY